MFKHLRDKLATKVISTLIIITETFNFGFLIQIINSTICEKINNKYYLSNDLKIDCDEEGFVKLVIFCFT